LRSHGLGRSRGSERIAAGTVHLNRSCRCAVSWQEKDPNLLLLNRRLVGLLNVRPLHSLFSLAPCLHGRCTYQRSNVGKLFVGGDKDRLHKELVAALCIWRRVLLHSLEENYANTLVCCSYSEACARRAAGGVLCTSTSLPGSMRPLFGLTQYLSCHHQLAVQEPRL
jgi:hypothetical protein